MKNDLTASQKSEGNKINNEKRPIGCVAKVRI